MTREEAIQALKDLADMNVRYGCDDKWIIALHMAIEALSTPSGDLISRQWLLDVYGDYIGDNGEPKYHVPLEVVRQNIKDAPSAELVRCKDCKQRRVEGDRTHYYYCDFLGSLCGDNEYCSFGERREP